MLGGIALACVCGVAAWAASRCRAPPPQDGQQGAHAPGVAEGGAAAAFTANAAFDALAAGMALAVGDGEPAYVLADEFQPAK